MESHQSKQAETSPASDPRPLIEDPLDPQLSPSGVADGSGVADEQAAHDLTAAPNPVSPPSAPTVPPRWAPVVVPSATPSPTPPPLSTLASGTIAIVPPAAAAPPPPPPTPVDAAPAPVDTPLDPVATASASDLVDTPVDPVATASAPDLVDTPLDPVDSEQTPVDTPLDFVAPAPVDAPLDLVDIAPDSDVVDKASPSDPVDAPPKPVDSTPDSMDTAPTPVDAAPDPVETAPEPVDAAPALVAIPSTYGAAPPPPPAHTAPAAVDPEPPTFVTTPAIDVAMPAAAAMGAVETAPRPAGPSAREPAPPRWWAKYVMWLGTAIIVVIIVAIIRSNSPGTTRNSPVASSPGSSATPSVQVSKAVLNQFTSISKTLDTANVAATKALANGSNQSVAQVATELAPYLTALDTFNFDLHLMTWPTAMQAPSRDLILQTQALASFLGSVLSTNTAGLHFWFTQFHALAQRTQASDNVVRHDIGLPRTSNYP